VDRGAKRGGRLRARGPPVSRLTSTSDLRSSERIFVTAMQRLGFARFESLRIVNGELVLEPWPKTPHLVKFGSEDMPTSLPAAEFCLKRQVGQFFEYIRAVDAGEIRCLEVRHGLPFSMEVSHRNNMNGEGHG
jgi:hypothetical protein